MSSVCVTTKTLQADAGQSVSVTSHAIDLVASCIVEVVNRLAVHISIIEMTIPSG
ncbi:hypothetical protein ACJJH9_12590 [Microbulbifer sp. DLAB2-AF]|uniref:hypothetical protein n=1 Tax=Microbulbifer sp. DLAB2-AF TaxID=3243395 RepID=UPI004039FBC1